MSYIGPLIIVILSSASFSHSHLQDKQQSKQNAQSPTESVFLSIRSIAEQTESEDAEASGKIDKIIFAVGDPRILSDLTVRLRERELSMHKEYDGVCDICLRYFSAYQSTMSALSNLKTDEAAKQLVQLMTVERCKWQAMPMKVLLYNISLMGKRTLPYLEELMGKHAQAETIIEAVRKGEVLW